jgi:predicted metal-dependent peptidase
MPYYTPRSDPEFKMTKARADLISIQPFFGTLALRLALVPIDHPKIPVMGTDGASLFYKPDAVKDMPQQQVMGVVAHEVLHCAFQHMFRRRYRESEKWNKACDYVINAILLQEGFSLPKSRLFNRKYSDMSAEEVYEKLPTEPSGNGKGGAPGGWDFGSSLDPALPDPATGEAKSASAVKAASKDWEIATKQAAHISKQQGNLPGNLSELIEDLLTPQIPWREQLWRFFSQRKPDRITWNRPNRRLIHTGVYLPTRRFVPTGDVVVAVDTSGSISERELQHFASEFNEIHRTLRPKKTYVLDIDTKIHSVKEYSEYDTPTFEMHGRGGTRFEPVFDWVRDENIMPDAIVYLTDGYASFPPPVLDIPVLWVITNHDVKPPWGEHLILEVA